MYKLSEEHGMLRELVKKFVRNELMPLEKNILDRFASGQPAALSDEENLKLFKQCKELGLWALDVPEEAGGANLPAVALVGVNEELGYTAVPFTFPPDSPNLHMMLATVNPEQRPEADVNIEFQSRSKLADQSMKLAFFFRDANEKYATDYPAAVGNHMSNTDSTEFQDLVPSISLRENERGMQIGAGWNPHYHQATDLYSAYSDKDFRLGLNAAQTTLGAVAQLTGAKLDK
jgi:hypothetical protein